MPQLKYLEIKERLLERLLHLRHGDKLPSERNLGKEYDCSFLTVRKALDLLHTEGHIRRRLGSGTFVHKPQGGIGKPDHIGLLLHQNGDSYSLRLATAIEQHAQLAQITIHTRFISDAQEQALLAIEQLRDLGCGSSMLPWLPAEQEQQLYQLCDQSVLPLCFPFLLPQLEAHCFEHSTLFGTNAEQRIALTSHYLTALGFGALALLAPLDAHPQIIQKLEHAYLSHISVQQLDCHCLLAHPGLTYTDIAKRWKTQTPHLGIIAFDDHCAAQFIHAAHELHIEAGKDYGIIGFNDTSDAQSLIPPLTTIPQDFDYLAAALIKHAQALALGASAQSEERPPLQIKSRASCGEYQHEQAFIQQLCLGPTLNPQ